MKIKVNKTPLKAWATADSAFSNSLAFYIRSSLLVWLAACVALPAQAVRWEEAYQSYSEENYELAYEQFLELSELGNKDAQYSVAMFYLKGLGVPVNHLQAYAWFKLAATQGDEDSQEMAQAIHEAMTESQREAGDAQFQQLLTRYGDEAVEQAIYPATSGTTGDQVTDALFLKPIAPDYPSAAARRGKVGSVVVEFDVGKDGRTRNHRVVSYTDDVFLASALDAAREMIYKPATLNGARVESPGMQYRFTYKMTGGEEDQRLVYRELKSMQDKATAGSSVDRYRYAQGLGLLTQYLGDEKKTEFGNPNDWLVKSAKDGLPQAKFRLGLAALKGDQCAADVDKSYFWLNASAEDGLPEAQVALGVYLINTGEPEKVARGGALLKSASEAGDARGKLEYAKHLALRKENTKKDIEMAQQLVSTIDEDEFLDPVSLYEARYLIYSRAGDRKEAKKSLKDLKKVVKRYDLPWEAVEENIERLLSGKEISPLIQDA